MTSALLFGPAPATLTHRDRQHADVAAFKTFDLRAVAVQQQRAGASRSGPARRCSSGSPGLEPLFGQPVAADALVVPLACFAAVYFVLNSGLTALAIALEKRQSPLAVWRSHFARGVAELLRGGLGGVVWSCCSRSTSACVALAAVIPLLAVIHLAMQLVDGPHRGCRAARRDRRSPVSLDDRRAVDGDRSQGRRHQQPHPSRAALRDGPGARRSASLDEQTLKAHPGRGAAARHRQARGAGAHSQQARQADAGRVRDDEAARRRRRRHPVVDRLSVPGGADRPRPSRELGRLRLSERAEGRRDSDRRAHPVGGRLLRRADFRSPVPRGDDRRPKRWRSSARGAAPCTTRRSSTCSSASAATSRPMTGQAAAAEGDSADQQGRRRRRRRRPVPAPRRRRPPTAPTRCARSPTSRASSAAGPSAADVASMIWSHVRHVVPDASCAFFLNEPATRRGGREVRRRRRLVGAAGPAHQDWRAADRLGRREPAADRQFGRQARSRPRSGVRGPEVLPVAAAGDDGTLAGVLSLYATEPFRDEQVQTLQSVVPHLALMFLSVEKRDAAAAVPAGMRQPLRVVASR